jgi:hypothetical protein
VCLFRRLFERLSGRTRRLDLVNALLVELENFRQDFVDVFAEKGRPRTTTRLPIRKRRYVARELTTTHGIASDGDHMSTAEWLIVGLSFYVYLVARGLSKQIEGVERRLERRLASPEERAELDAQQTLEKSGGTLCATPSYSSWL